MLRNIASSGSFKTKKAPAGTTEDTPRNMSSMRRMGLRDEYDIKATVLDSTEAVLGSGATLLPVSFGRFTEWPDPVYVSEFNKHMERR
ncbi:hypothetical protein E4U58_001348 [Claviceps cyperi]|nr:hypothetical protein E4U58_001348 [Claviceps cyperi]